MYYLHGSQPQSGDFLFSFSSLLAQQHGFLFCNSRLLCQQISGFLWPSLHRNARSLCNGMEWHLSTHSDKMHTASWLVLSPPCKTKNLPQLVHWKGLMMKTDLLTDTMQVVNQNTMENSQYMWQAYTNALSNFQNANLFVMPYNLVQTLRRNLLPPSC